MSLEKSTRPFIIFDIETDGLYDEVTKLHCLSYQKYLGGDITEKNTIVSHQAIIDFFSQDAYFVGHNIVRYDIPVLNKLLNTDLQVRTVDTLGVSWYLYPNHKKHGLEWWGNYLGVEKLKIDDWENLSLQNYIQRCETDVEINMKLFKFFFAYLSKIYDNFNSVMRMLGYINFKLDSLREQEMSGITLDLEKCNFHLQTLEKMFTEKREVLSGIMPKDLGTIIKSRPKVMYKKDGNFSRYGKEWIRETSLRGLNFDSVDSIREEPNPGSNKQLKEWLFGLGWKPQTFKVSKVTGKKVEQVSLPFGSGICPSVKELYKIEPNLKEIEGYFMIKHRIGIFKSYLKNLKGAKVYATAHGFTNTMRLTHSEPIVNLPKPGVFYGKEIREVLTIPNKDYLMCGSDVSSLEDSTKQHYIYFYDPEYVKEMRVPGFDPHIDIGVLAGLISQADADWFKWAKKQKILSQRDEVKYEGIKKARYTSKTANFAATYGAGSGKIAETAKISFKEGANLHKIYWKRNSAIKKIADSCTVKTISYDNRNQKWLYNPVSGFWMFLKAEKDRFNTLNQSTGVCVFDFILKRVRQNFKNYHIPVLLQYHDEFAFVCKKELKEAVKKILQKSIKEVNEKLQLNVEIGISVDWGINYAEVH